MAALLVVSTLLLVMVVESAVIVVGGDKGWTTGFDYAAWATANNLHVRVGDSLVFVNSDPDHHTVSLVDSADAYQRCTLGAIIIPIAAGTNHTMSIPSRLESKTLYAVSTVAGHCLGGQKMQATVLPALQLNMSNNHRNDADMNRYICWTTAILLIVACFWNSG
jgi:hypothetical protein